MSNQDINQIDLIYEYMKAHKKILVLPIRCKLCKTKKSKIEFYTTTKVCKDCWGDYLKMSRSEKKGNDMTTFLGTVKVNRNRLGEVDFKLFDTVLQTSKENRCGLNLAREILLKNGYECKYSLKNGRFQQVYVKDVQCTM